MGFIDGLADFVMEPVNGYKENVSGIFYIRPTFGTELYACRVWSARPQVQAEAVSKKKKNVCRLDI